MLTAILVILILAFLAIATILAGGIGLWTRFVAAEEILKETHEGTRVIIESVDKVEDVTEQLRDKFRLYKKGGGS